MENITIYRRGDIYYANLGPAYGSEQGGKRPVLVLQNDVGNFHSPTIIVAPLTSKIGQKKNLPTHCVLEKTAGTGLPSLVLLEQIKTIDKKRILSYMGRADKNDMRNVNEALRVSLGLYIPETVEAP